MTSIKKLNEQFKVKGRAIKLAKSFTKGVRKRRTVHGGFEKVANKAGK